MTWTEASAEVELESLAKGVVAWLEWVGEVMGVFWVEQAAAAWAKRAE